MASKPPAIIMWLDIETDGNPDPVAGHLIEFACMFTQGTPPFVELESFHSLVYCAFDIPTVRERANKVVREMHDANGLWKAWEVANLTNEARTPVNIQNHLLDRLHANGCGEAGEVACGGSGVAAFDRPWLRYWMPGLEKMFPYWSYDVGSVRRLARLAGFDIDVNPSYNHRALSDVHNIVSQARYFCDTVKE